MTGTEVPAERELRELYESEWRWRTTELGELAHCSPTAVPGGPLPDVSADREQQRRQRWESTLADLDRIDPAALGPAALSDYGVYRYQLTTMIDRRRFRMYERPANGDTAFWNDLLAAPRRVLADTDDARTYLEHVESMGAFVRANIENMRLGIARGFAPPAVTMVGRASALREFVTGGPSAAASFANPVQTLPPSVSAAARAALHTEIETTVVDQVMPALETLDTFLRQEYFPRLPERIDLASQPDGAECYQAQLDEFTTSGLTGEQIHRIGLDEVTALSQEMAQVAAGAGYRSAGDMLAFMRTDPQFVETTPGGLLRWAAWHAKRFDAVSERYFGRQPRRRFAIVEVDPEIAPFYTAGRGGDGEYLLNTYNLPARKLYSLAALTLHEAAPGHCFQVPFALEMTHLPDFRRADYISAYGEGWALYTERLGTEMGMYESPYDAMGMLSYQMWRAVRLVVDPGVHLLGWTRERARAFLRDHTALDEHEVTTEVDRYISWPGQATSYYLGMMRILELRAEAEQALGERFSLPAFHDLVLSLGSVPLSVLSDEVHRFVADGGHSPFATAAP
ncbi:DUF885 domain-containing protein [Nocardioides sp.]|uniref:DUF885 domain-containing protein n=1 Tax=Nocardioides sp. TaxID=35761 RepID=UPI0039E5DB8F